ncbi:heavy metal-associated domain-containing protein, partial [Actinomyces oris]|uniref:heavy metal-associated domain-containing protein n=1 Tax=Actinomyces oris TaxID=544580 RepID=UPI0028D47E18
MSTTSQESGGQQRTVNLSIGGMTCASCVARVEKKLNKLDGVSASVNLATESARITAPSAVSVDDLLATVARAGYTGALLDTASPDESAQSEASPAGEPASAASTAPASGPSTPGSAEGGRGTKGTGGRATLSMAATPATRPGAPAGTNSTNGTTGTSPRSASGSGAKSLGASHMERAADLRLRLIYCLILSVPIMAISM